MIFGATTLHPSGIELSWSYLVTDDKEEETFGESLRDLRAFILLVGFDPLSPEHLQGNT